MRKRIKDGGSAFPYESTPDGRFYSGMTLRDYFAGQALAGSISASENNGFINVQQAGKFAAEAYLVADAMIAEREKEDIDNA